MGLIITENSVKTAAAILDILGKNKCTVADAEDILSFCGKVIQNRATVPEQDYLADFTDRFLNPPPSP
ncbi:MAG: hypothetical protein ACI4WS_14545 [Oscillospiraceae bacterium]